PRGRREARGSDRSRRPATNGRTVQCLDADQYPAHGCAEARSPCGAVHAPLQRECRDECEGRNRGYDAYAEDGSSAPLGAEQHIEAERPRTRELPDADREDEAIESVERPAEHRYQEPATGSLERYEVADDQAERSGAEPCRDAPRGSPPLRVAARGCPGDRGKSRHAQRRTYQRHRREGGLDGSEAAELSLRDKRGHEKH